MGDDVVGLGTVLIRVKEGHEIAKMVGENLNSGIGIEIEAGKGCRLDNRIGRARRRRDYDTGVMRRRVHRQRSEEHSYLVHKMLVGILAKSMRLSN